jgi:hypothetical protein
VNFAAEIDEAKLMQRKGGGVELLFDESDGAFYFARGNVILREALQRAQGNEIEEAVETLAPAGFGKDETKALPVAETVRVKTQDAAGFRPRVTF